MHLLISFVLLMTIRMTHSGHEEKRCPGIKISGNCDGWDLENVEGYDPLDQGGKSQRACMVVNYTAHCSYGGWSTVPANLPTNIKTLLLSHNYLSTIPNKTFSSFTSLIVLDLSFNLISQLFPESFSVLSNLKFLNLKFNILAYKEGTFPDGVFQPLSNLMELLMSKNNADPAKPGLSYPSRQLATLTSLTTLHMDGLRHPVFDSNFQHLANLTTLSLNGYICGNCRIYALHKDTFRYLSQVTCLYLTNCFIQGGMVHPLTFKPLAKLVELDLTHNEDIGVGSLPNVTYGLKNTTTLKYLGLHLIIPRYSLGICLTKDSLEFFPPSVEYLNAQENSLQGVDFGIVDLLPHKLLSLDLSGNDFVFGRSLLSLHKMKFLRELKLNGRTFIYQLPTHFPFKVNFSRPLNDTACRTRLMGDNGDDSKYTFVLKLPPNLISLEMNNAGLTYRLTRMDIDPNNSLEVLEARENRFPSLEGPITGLGHLEKLDLSFDYVKAIGPYFFDNMSSLVILNLSGNFLGNYFNSDASRTVFSCLLHLEDLDLSFNAIEVLHHDIFHPLIKLKHLRLDRNLLTRFHCNIAGLHNLIFVNLNHTHIPTLNSQTRSHIDALISSGGAFQVDMSMTPISCDCTNFDFLKWMVSSPAFDKRFYHYRCDYNDLTLENITDGYDRAMGDLRRQCISQEFLLMVVTSCVTVVLVLIIIGICYRFRWNLRYLYHVAYLHYKRETAVRSSQYQFDAFICYAKEDEDFVSDTLEPEMNSRSLTLYVHGRDFIAGEYISSNIVSAICQSRKTLVIVTPNMLRSSWCNYEIQMANMEAVHTGRKVLVFLLKGRIPQRHQNVNIVYNIQINTYLEYPSPEDADEQKMKAMWDKLARDLRD